MTQIFIGRKERLRAKNRPSIANIRVLHRPASEPFSEKNVIPTAPPNRFQAGKTLASEHSTRSRPEKILAARPRHRPNRKRTLKDTQSAPFTPKNILVAQHPDDFRPKESLAAQRSSHPTTCKTPQNSQAVIPHAVEPIAIPPAVVISSWGMSKQQSAVPFQPCKTLNKIQVIHFTAKQNHSHQKVSGISANKNI